MDYAKAFRIIRAAFGMRQDELADRLNVGPSQLSLIERGKRQPSLKTLDSLTSSLGVPRSLVALLASEPEDLKNQNEEDVANLARALLRVLVSASDPKQQVIRFEDK